jgi:hypothetical protein
MIMRLKHILGLSLTLGFCLISTQVQALPAFARSTSLSCSSCHSAFPALNAEGRLFKANGYRLSTVSVDGKTSDFSKDISKLPIAAAIVSRPLIVNDPGGSADTSTEIRAIHEAELYVAGVLYKNISGFMEYEAEGEDGFGSLLSTAALNYDINDAVHIQFANAPSFFADPYDTLSDARRLTVEHYNITDDTFTDNGDNGGKFRHSRQQVSLFGRFAGNKLFYNLGVGGLTDDNIGSESRVMFARLAFDVTPSVMIGGFGMNGTCKITMDQAFGSCDAGAVTATQDRDFTRAGLDVQADIGQTRLTAVYMNVSDDVVNSGTSVDNTDYYVQGVYYGKVSGKQLVPLVRFQSSENNDGKDTTERLIAGITYYLQENFKATLELGNDTSVPTGDNKTKSAIVQLEAIF